MPEPTRYCPSVHDIGSESYIWHAVLFGCSLASVAQVWQLFEEKCVVKVFLLESDAKCCRDWRESVRWLKNPLKHAQVKAHSHTVWLRTSIELTAFDLGFKFRSLCISMPSLSSVCWCSPVLHSACMCFICGRLPHSYGFPAKLTALDQTLWWLFSGCDMILYSTASLSTIV